MAGVLETLVIPRVSGFPSASLAPVRGASSVSALSGRRRSGRVADFGGLKSLSTNGYRESLISRPARRGGRIVCEAQDTAVQVPAVTDSSWQTEVLESDKPVLVEFWAPWCGPCRMIHPVVDELAKEFTGKLKCYKVNTDESPSIATRYGIRSIPTVIIFKDGEKKDAIIGAVPKTTLATSIEKFL